MEDLEEIEAEKKNYGKSSAMRKLLLLLPCRVDTWLALLLSAMKKAGYTQSLENIHAELADRSNQ